MVSSDPPPTPAAGGSAETPAPAGSPGHVPGAPSVTRASAAWVATGAALLLLTLLIVFMLQNSTKVEVQFFGLTGTIPLGIALLIAAVGGGVVVAIAGIARVTQLRLVARRTRRDASHA